MRYPDLLFKQVRLNNSDTLIEKIPLELRIFIKAFNKGPEELENLFPKIPI